jgi:hypothetical protein
MRYLWVSYKYLIQKPRNEIPVTYKECKNTEQGDGGATV